MVITIVFYHPLHVPLGPTHLLLDLSLPFPFEPPLHTKARAKPMCFAFKGDCIHHLPLAIASLLFLQRCSKISKLAHGLVPPLFGAMGCCLLPLLPLLLSIPSECESALRSLLSLLFCLLAHEHPLLVVGVSRWVLALCPSAETHTAAPTPYRILQAHVKRCAFWRMNTL